MATARQRKNQVVVITGASSGVGRAAALAFSKKKAFLVLTARRGEPLEALVEECGAAGGTAVAMTAEVSDAPSMFAVAQVAEAAFGRVDVWVNSAAAGAYGLFETLPAAIWDQVIATNVVGYANGSRAALAQFRKNGTGVLINVASILGVLPQPYAGAYVASEHAIMGFTRSLRQEMALTGRDIHVCAVLPQAIDTPFFQHAANFAGREVRPIRPILSPEKVAAVIVRLARKPKAEVFVGRLGPTFQRLRFFAPRLTDRLFARQTARRRFDLEKPARPSEGNVFAPVAEGADVSGGWKRRGWRRAARVAIGASVLALPLVIAGRRATA